MRLIEYKRKADVQRDMDLIRELLLRIEQDPRTNGKEWVQVDWTGMNHSQEEIAYHLGILVQADLIRANVTGSMPMVSSLTWDGHEFLDNIKDVGVWRQVKVRIAGLPGLALPVIAKIAEAEIMKKLGL